MVILDTIHIFKKIFWTTKSYTSEIDLLTRDLFMGFCADQRVWCQPFVTSKLWKYVNEQSNKNTIESNFYWYGLCQSIWLYYLHILCMLSCLNNSVGWVWEDRWFLQEIDNVFQDFIVLRHGDVHVCLTYAIYCLPCLGLKMLDLYVCILIPVSVKPVSIWQYWIANFHINSVILDKKVKI